MHARSSTSTQSTYRTRAKLWRWKGGKASWFFLTLPAGVAEEVRRLSVECCKAVECEGMARVDFLLESATGALYINEINTIPGFTSISMYPKLWEASGLDYTALLSRLVELALSRHARRAALQRARGT